MTGAAHLTVDGRRLRHNKLLRNTRKALRCWASCCTVWDRVRNGSTSRRVWDRLPPRYNKNRLGGRSCVWYAKRRFLNIISYAILHGVKSEFKNTVDAK